MKPNINIRPQVPGDLSFILSSWLNSYCDSSEFAKGIPRETYFSEHRKVVEHIVARPSVTVLVAVAPDTEDVILGYVVFEQRKLDTNIIHYIYVKRAFGVFGIAKELFAALPFGLDKQVFASHMTYKGKRLILKYGLTYSPYML